MYTEKQNTIGNIQLTQEEPNSLSIEEINDTEKFRSLKDLWNKLLQESADNNIFLTWEWLFTWWRYFGKGKKLRILLIKDSDRVIGIAPFMQSTYRKGLIKINVLENLSSLNSDYNGIILTEKKQESVVLVLRYLEKIIQNDNAIVRMSHIPATSNFFSLFKEQSTSFMDSISISERQLATCPYILLPVTMEEYHGSLSQKTRQNLRRAVKFLQKDNHSVEFKKFTSNDDLKKKMDTLFELHIKRWQGSSVGKRFKMPEMRSFYIDVSSMLKQNDWLNLSFMDVDGQPASAGWGFNYNNEFCYMTCAYDPEFTKYSVGTLHMMSLIEDSIANKRHKFDFLQGSEAFKSLWSQGKAINMQINMTKRSMMGKFRLSLFNLLQRWDVIRSRNFKENYRLFQEKRRRAKEAKKSIKEDQ